MLERATRKPAAKTQVKSAQGGQAAQKEGCGILPGSGFRAGAQLGRHRPGGRASSAIRRCSCRTRDFSRSITGYGFEAHPVNLSEPLPPEEMAQVLGRISSTATSRIFAKSPYEQIDNYVKDCWGMIVVDRQMGGEGSAARAGGGQAGRHLRRQCHPVSGDQALCARAWQAVGAYHLLLGERDRGSGHPAASVGLAADDKKGFRRYRKRFNEVIKPIHDALQRLSQIDRREELSARPVLRGLAVHEPAALSDGR